MALMPFPESRATFWKVYRLPDSRCTPKLGGAKYLLNQTCGNSEHALPKKTPLLLPTPGIYAQKGLCLPT